MAEENKPADTRTATQRLTDAENNIGQLGLTLDYVTKDLVLMKNALKLLDSKLNALVKAMGSGEQVTDEVIDNIMVQNNINEMHEKVVDMISRGMLTPEDVVSDGSFIVGQESDGDGNVTNPRVQMTLKRLEKDVQDKLIGIKVGDSVSFQDGKLIFKILETYKINFAPVPSQPSDTTPAPTTEAPPSSTPNDPNASA